MNTVAATVPVGEFPMDLAFDLSGTSICNTGRSPAKGSVSVIDAASTAVSGTIPIGKYLQSVAMGPDGMAYVTVNGNNTMQVIDTDTNLVTTHINFIAAPQRVTVNPAGGYAYVIVGENSLTVIDISTNIATTTVIGVGDTPEGVAFTPDGARAYIANINDGTVSVIDAIHNVVTETTAIAPGAHQGQGPGGIVAGRDGAFVYVVNLSYTAGTVSVIETDGSTVTDTIPVGRLAVGTAISPDGSTLYVTNLADDTVSVIDTVTNEVTDTVAVGHWPTAVAVSPDGSTVYVTNGNDDTVSVISVD
jgi:YVTN family beta-propeller protein